MATTEKIPVFKSPEPATNPTLDRLLHDNFLKESSEVTYSTYRLLSPLDPMEISKSSSVCFRWKDENAFLNT